MIIGKKAVFVRMVLKHGAIPDPKRYEGIVIDKFRARDKSEVDRKIHVIDFYMVQFANGVTGAFACDELVQIVEPEKKEIES